MNCSQTQNLLHAYIDGELDLVRHLEIEHHLADCAPCTDFLESQQSLRKAIASASLYNRAPKDLKSRLFTSLEREPAAAPARSSLTAHRFRFAFAASIGLFALGLLGTIGLLLARSQISFDDRLARDLVSSHVRSLQVAHLTDIPSSDRHEVKPWFEGKLDFSPTVVDLKNDGFPLVGGRLDYLDNRPVAALVYQRRKHMINVFIWPTSAAAPGEQRTSVQQGYQLIQWTLGGMTYCAVSDLNAEELNQFVHLLQK